MKKKYENLCVGISCGGTGGHFYPGLTVARELQRQGGKAVLFLSGRHREKQAEIADAFGVKSILVDAAPRPRGLISGVKFFYCLTSGFFRSRRNLRKHHINVMLSMGSFASFPASLAARSLSVPLYLHDGNARIGRANRFLSRFAEYLALSFDPVSTENVRCLWDVCGMPLRPEIIDAQFNMTQGEAITEINYRYGCSLHKGRTTFLVFGGSQGAEIFNRTLPLVFGRLADLDIQVIHLTGDEKYSQVEDLYKGVSFPVLTLPSSSEMRLFYLACDSVISRSGGSSVAEIAYFGKYAFLVPYPYAAENHQYDNARYLSNAGGATIIDNSNCEVAFIEKMLRQFIDEKNDYLERGRMNRLAAHPEATAKLLDYLQAVADVNGEPFEEGLIY